MCSLIHLFIMAFRFYYYYLIIEFRMGSKSFYLLYKNLKLNLYKPIIRNNTIQCQILRAPVLSSLTKSSNMNIEFNFRPLPTRIFLIHVYSQLLLVQFYIVKCVCFYVRQNDIKHYVYLLSNTLFCRKIILFHNIKQCSKLR